MADGRLLFDEILREQRIVIRNVSAPTGVLQIRRALEVPKQDRLLVMGLSQSGVL